jgi:hypothetical protein
MNNETRDERLRRLLREADSAVTDPGLTLDEVRDMRRTVLSAVPERKRRLFPVFATAGAVLVAALILIAVLIPRPEKPSAPPQIAVVLPKAVQPPPPPREEPRLAEEKVEEKKTPVRRKRRAPRPPIVQPEPVEPEATAVIASAEPQQIQFSTPGGTRIIWLLSPGDGSIQGE